MPLLFVLLGFGLVAISLSDIFQSVIVPRPATRSLRPSAYLSRFGWRFWRYVAHRIPETVRREDFLGIYAPLILVVLLVFWIVTMIIGYGFIFYGLREELRPIPDLFTAIYFAGTSLLTIGYGDVAPIGAAARIFAILAGASGFAVVAILTTFLFSIFGAYQQREAFVVAFTNRAGAPPSGVELIEMHTRLGLTGTVNELMRESQKWMASVLETHLAYPVLTYFRSTHDDISWIGVLGAILDASTLAIAAVDAPKGEALITQRLARHVVRDFSHYFGFADGNAVGVERSEFDAAFERLRDAGVAMKDRESAWGTFAAARATYATQLADMANFWRIPPAQWIGDRSLIGHHPPLKITVPEPPRAEQGARSSSP